MRRQVEEIHLSECITIFHEEKESLEEVNLSGSFATFDDNSTHHVLKESQGYSFRV